jgi:hypothetical protein
VVGEKEVEVGALGAEVVGEGVVGDRAVVGVEGIEVVEVVAFEDAVEVARVVVAAAAWLS